MLIATRSFNREKVVSLAGDADALIAYVESIVPDKYKHIDALSHNTRYYINQKILDDDKIPMDIKMKLTEALTRRLHIVGYLGKYITCDELDSSVNMQRVMKYYEGERNEQKV